MVAERNALMEHVYPKLKDFCRDKYGLEFQVGSYMHANNSMTTL